LAHAAIFASRVLFERTFNHARRYFSMKSSNTVTPIVALLAFCLALFVPTLVSAQEIDSSIAACLKAWGDHPFGKNPKFKTLGTTVKMFGIGKSAGDDIERTGSPSLVLVNPIFNLMGASTIELLNPNGWYCLRTTVNLLGVVNVRAHCKAQLAASSGGISVRGDNTENRAIKDLGVTVMGTFSIERPCN
jgi:hypothetical protein